MANTDSADSKRKKVSDRGFAGPDGTPVDKIELATGARYTLLDPVNGNRDFIEQVGEAGKFATMLAIFGFHTKVGNVVNTVLNDKDEPGGPGDAAAAVEDFIEAAKEGTWAERVGGVGARVDKDALAGAIVEVAEASGKTADYAAIRQKLEEDAKYLRMARAVPQVATAYAARVGRTTRTIDDLLTA